MVGPEKILNIAEGYLIYSTVLNKLVKRNEIIIEILTKTG